MAANINLGKVVITPRGAWDNQTAYSRLDLVYTLEGSYIALIDNIGVQVTDNSAWQLIAGRGPAGTGNVSVIESGLEAGKKYVFIPSNNNSAEGRFEEFSPSESGGSFTQQQADWDQTETDQPDFIKNKPELFSGDYNHLENKPHLFNGDYHTLENKPDLFSGDYNDLENKPILFSGNYSDLTDKPTLPEKLSDLPNDKNFISEEQANATFQQKVTGKGLSTHDFTTEEKEKLANIENGAQKNQEPIHKYITLKSSDWKQNDNNKWEIVISENDLSIHCFIEIWAADEESSETVKEAIIYENIIVTINESQKYFTLTSLNQPSKNININYVILY